MFSKLHAYLAAKKHQAMSHATPDTHIENLLRHPKVSLVPLAVSDDALAMPIWFDSPTTSTTTATYDGVFWEIEPMGEYLFYLAGDFAKNERGLLRFRTAPIEIRAERCFEKDVVDVTQHDGQIEQAQARETAADITDLEGLNIGDAVNALLESAQRLGYERWVIRNNQSGSDISVGISRVALGRHFASDKPYIEVIDERLYSAKHNATDASILRVITWADDPDLQISDILSAHNRIAAIYRDMPAIQLTGATRL